MRLILASILLAATCALVDATEPAVRALAFSPDGRYLAATSSEPNEVGHVTVWEITTGKLCFIHKEPKGIPAIAYSPDGKVIVFGSFNENAVVVNTTTWTIDRNLPSHGNSARGLAFSHDGKTLAVTSYDGFIRLWDVPTWSVRKSLENSHAGWVYAAAFSKDAKTLATCSADNSTKLWDLESGKCLHSFKHEQYSRRIFFMPDDLNIVYTAHDKLMIRNRHTGISAIELNVYADAFAISSDGKQIAAEAGSASVYAIDLQPANETMTKTIRQHIARWDDDDIKIRDQASKDLVTLGIPAWPFLREAQKVGSTPEVRYRARLVLQSSEPLNKFQHSEGRIESVAFSPDDLTLATGGVDGVVRLWNIADRKETRLFRQNPTTKPSIPRSEF